MLYLLLLATVSVALAADAEAEAQPELKAAESALPIRVHGDERRHHFRDGLELIRSRGEHERRPYLDHHDNRRGPQILEIKDDDHPGPVILRSPDPLPNHGHPDIERQNRIIADVYSPDYYQPTWILDYRYLKTGGRDYTRGPGGQILILPRNVRTNEHKDFSDFDSLLEHLRLSRLSERASKYGGSRYRDDHEARHAFQNVDHGHYGHEQNWLKANRHH